MSSGKCKVIFFTFWNIYVYLPEISTSLIEWGRVVAMEETASVTLRYGQ